MRRDLVFFGVLLSPFLNVLSPSILVDGAIQGAFDCRKCNWALLPAGSPNWCSCCGHDCGGYRNDCLLKAKFCQTCSTCIDYPICDEWRPANFSYLSCRDDGDSKGDPHPTVPPHHHVELSNQSTVLSDHEAPICGNGIVEGNEDCDPGRDPDLHPCCNLACKFYSFEDRRICRVASGFCDAPDYCDGKSGLCSADKVYGPDKVCRPVKGECDVEERCLGTSEPFVNESELISLKACPKDEVKSGIVCRKADGPCDLEEKCDGVFPICPANLFTSQSSICRNSTGLPCDPPEFCTGKSPSCPPDDVAPPSFVCRERRGVCEKSTYCDGTNRDCPALVLEKKGSVCREAAGVCDVPEVCDGRSYSCPPDTFSPPSKICREVGGVCDKSENCTGRSVTCPDDLFLFDVTCRPVAGVCDSEEVCLGDSKDCPPNTFRSSGVICNRTTSGCHGIETCTGSSVNCPHRSFLPPGTRCDDHDDCTSNDVCNYNGECIGEQSCNCYEDSDCIGKELCSIGRCDKRHCVFTPAASGSLCRNESGDCDTAEYCDGISMYCPADVVVSSGVPCGDLSAKLETCEGKGSVCDGTSPVCPAVAPAPSGSLCRPAKGPCDEPEFCTGSSIECPSDIRKPNSSLCYERKGLCDRDLYCDGLRISCPVGQVFLPKSTICRESVGVCDAPEFCTGTQIGCPADVFAPVSNVCRVSAGACDDAEYCSGISSECPPDSVKSSSFVCRPANGSCDLPETCTGTSVQCPVDVRKRAGQKCGFLLDAGPCVRQLYCDGESSKCAGKQFTSGNLCRPSAGECDVEEFCDGTSATCPPDITLSRSVKELVLCRNASGDCDIPEFCIPGNAHCPKDAFRSPGFLCDDGIECTFPDVCSGTSAVCSGPNKCDCKGDSDCDDGNICTTDVCVLFRNSKEGFCNYTASNKGSVCRPKVGECDVEEICDGKSFSCPEDAVLNHKHVCRPSWGSCDVPEMCTGVSGVCPVDAFFPEGKICRESEGGCDTAEVCSGHSKDCPADRLKPAGVVCRHAEALCDGTEVCDGIHSQCPTDAFLEAGTECRPSKGDCDVPELCTGASIACPVDIFASSTNVCRHAGGECDLAENCTGYSPECPGDVRAVSKICRNARGPCDKDVYCLDSSVNCPQGEFLQPRGQVCRLAVGPCDEADVCSGVSYLCPSDNKKEPGEICRAAAGECDVAEVCDGISNSCPDDLRRVGYTCRPAVDFCDKPEVCSARSPYCPRDLYMDSGFVCRRASESNSCDEADFCSGESPYCPPDMRKPDGSTCTKFSLPLGGDEGSSLCRLSNLTCQSNGLCGSRRGDCICKIDVDCNDNNPCSVEKCVSGECFYAPSPPGVICRMPLAGGCDLPERCDGRTMMCPRDAVVGAGVVCRQARDVCDVAEKCDGSSPVCPVDFFLAASTICRLSAGVCDIAENCSGTDASCPPDILRPSNTVCRPKASSCDTAETCYGDRPDCPPDNFLPSGSSCDDGDSCTVQDRCRDGVCSGRWYCECTKPSNCESNNSKSICSMPTCLHGLCVTQDAYQGNPCDDGDKCTTGDVCSHGVCVGTLNCPVGDPIHVKGKKISVPCMGRGICCAGKCFCKRPYSGQACDVDTRPTPMPTTPSPTPAPSVHQLVVVTEPFVATTTSYCDKECFCLRGDADGDGLNDCVDRDYGISDVNSPIQVVVYDELRPNVVVAQLGFPSLSIFHQKPIHPSWIDIDIFNSSADVLKAFPGVELPFQGIGPILNVSVRSLIGNELVTSIALMKSAQICLRAPANFREDGLCLGTAKFVEHSGMEKRKNKHNVEKHRNHSNETESNPGVSKERGGNHRTSVPVSSGTTVSIVGPAKASPTKPHIEKPDTTRAKSVIMNTKSSFENWEENDLTSVSVPDERRLASGKWEWECVDKSVAFLPSQDLVCGNVLELNRWNRYPFFTLLPYERDLSSGPLSRIAKLAGVRASDKAVILSLISFIVVGAVFCACCRGNTVRKRKILSVSPVHDVQNVQNNPTSVKKMRGQFVIEEDIDLKEATVSDTVPTIVESVAAARRPISKAVSKGD